MNLFMFFDDKNLLLRENFSRKLATPQMLTESIYKDPLATITNGFPTVWFDEENEKYHMFYNGNINGKNYFLAAESDDGINYNPRNTAFQSGIENPVAPNQFLDLKGELASVYVDKTAPKEERLKALAVYGDHSTKRIIQNVLFYSADGINWHRQPQQWHNQGAEPGAFCFYNNVTKKHTLVVRPDAGVRRVCISETENFNKFTDARLVMNPDSLDQLLAEHYGMPTFPYENYFISFLWIYNAPNIPVRKYWGGKMNAQLVYSYNGTSFLRTLREPFFENHEEGSSTAGMVFPSDMYKTQKGELIVIANCTPYEHGEFSKDGGVVLPYKLRKDGFIPLEAERNARIITVAMLNMGGELVINLESPEQVTCALYTDNSHKSPDPLLYHDLIPIKGFGHEDCIPFSGDCVEWEPCWNDGKNFDEHKGKIVYIEIKMNKGRLYSYRANTVPMMICDLLRYHRHKIVPDITGKL